MGAKGIGALQSLFLLASCRRNLRVAVGAGCISALKTLWFAMFGAAELAGISGGQRHQHSATPCFVSIQPAELAGISWSWGHQRFENVAFCYVRGG